MALSCEPFGFTLLLTHRQLSGRRSLMRRPSSKTSGMREPFLGQQGLIV